MRVGLINGNIGCGKITRIEEDKIEMDVVLDREPPAPLQFTLIVANGKTKGSSSVSSLK